MKRTLLVLATALFLGTGGSAFAKKIILRDLPAKVVDVIDDFVPRKKLDDLALTYNAKGKRYIATLELKGDKILKVEISKSGKLIKISRDVAAKAMPKKVRATMDDFLGEDGELIDLKELTEDGKTSYIITIHIEGEDDFQIVVSEDGILVDGEQEIDFDELEAELRETVEELLGEDWVVGDIVRVTEDGEETYRVVIENTEWGSRIIITMDPDGNIIDEDIEFFTL